MSKTIKLFEFIKEAREELKKMGFKSDQIKSLLAGDGVTIEAEHEKGAFEMVEAYSEMGLNAHMWTSNGGHGYPDKEMVTVRI